MLKQTMRLLLLPAAAAVLVACGGGGGGGVSTFSIGGTAATGAPIAAGAVKIYDASGQIVASGETDDQGLYDLSVPLTATAPFVVEVSLAGQNIYSIVNEKNNTRTNVNQLTNALASMLSSKGNPELLVTELSRGTTTISAQNISQKKELLDTAIAPIKAAVVSLGQEVVDFHTGNFSADGTGLDKILDTANIFTTSLGGTAANSSVNVQIAFNIATDLENTRELPGILFNSGETIQQVTDKRNLIQISSELLPPKELGLMYQDFLTRMRTCYAIPKSQRVNGYTILAQECKDIFFNRNPGQFLDGGFQLGPNRFGGMFALEQPAKFSQTLSPVLIHNITGTGENLNGKAIISFRGEDSEGNYLNSKVVVQIYNLNGRKVFGAIGDQNPAEFYVNAEAVATNFPLKTTEAYDYLSSGYAAFVPSAVPGRGSVKKAVLTAPNNSIINMGKWGNRSQLFVCKTGQNPDNGDNCTGLPSFVQGFRYVDDQKHNNGDSPVSLLQVRSTLIYSRTQDSNHTSCTAFKTAYNNSATLCPRTDEEIERQTPGGLWTAEYTFEDGSNLILKARHPVRALSNRELAGETGPNSKAARLTPDTVTALKNLNQLALTDGRAYSSWSSSSEIPIWAPAAGGFNFAWTVGAGQEAPRKVKAIGRVAYDTTQNRSWNRNFNGNDIRPNWEDELNFKTNERSVTIGCKLAAGTGDVSCQGATTGDRFSRDVLPVEADVQTDGVTTNYANGAWMSTSLLWTSDNTATNLMRVYSWYDPSQ